MSRMIDCVNISREFLWSTMVKPKLGQRKKWRLRRVDVRSTTQRQEIERKREREGVAPTGDNCSMKRNENIQMIFILIKRDEEIMSRSLQMHWYRHFNRSWSVQSGKLYYEHAVKSKQSTKSNYNHRLTLLVKTYSCFISFLCLFHLQTQSNCHLWIIGISVSSIAETIFTRLNPASTASSNTRRDIGRSDITGSSIRGGTRGGRSVSCGVARANSDRTGGTGRR